MPVPPVGEGEDTAVIGKDQIKTNKSKTEKGINFRGKLPLIPIPQKIISEKLFNLYRKKLGSVWRERTMDLQPERDKLYNIASEVFCIL
jgi:hypothetical protein